MRTPCFTAAMFFAASLAFAQSESTFTRVDLPVGAGPNSVAVADLNGDGILDLAAARGAADTVSVFLGTGAGAFTHLSEIAAGPFPLSLQVADLNHDGAPDLLVGNFHAGTVTVLLGTGNGAFQPGRTSVASTYWVVNDWGYGGTPLSLNLADINGDGHLDVAVPLRGTGGVSVLLGAGDGSFPTLLEGTLMGCDDPQAVAFADFTGDGILDAAVASDWWCQGTVDGFGDGHFNQLQVHYFASPNSRSVQAADLNGDGHPDLVFANSWSSGITIHRADQTGAMLPGEGYATGALPAAVRLADMNGDGQLDAVVTNTGDGTLSMLYGDGAGRFGPAMTLVTGASPAGMAIGDLNGDGAPDVAVANEGDGTVSLFLTQASCDYDVTPPDIEAASASPSVLWPPRQRLEPVTLSVTAADACSAVSCRVTSVESPDGLLAPADWAITGDLTVRLRSERRGNGGPRVYQVTVRCVDAGGNASERIVEVTVPHDRRR